MPDITEDVVTALGVDAGAVTASHTVEAAWDCSINNMPFTFAISPSRPLQRQTAEFRKTRIDSEREPGEQSLDSGAWLRSGSSWHYGMGLVTAEPIEVAEDEARFRYKTGGGIDPWTPGRVGLLPAAERAFDSDTAFMIGVDGGVLSIDTDGGVWFTDDDTAEVGTLSGVSSLASNGTEYHVGTDDGIYQGVLPSGAPSKVWNTTAPTLVRWVKSRILAGVGPALHELVGTGPALPTALDPGTARPTGWVWSDFADSPNGIYAAGWAGDVSTIERVTLDSTDGTLNPPTVVAEMPRGERVLSLYTYVGSYLVVGTNRGVRVAAINTDGSVTVGPVLFDCADGVTDAVAMDRFVWVTVGGQGIPGPRSTGPGLYRIDLGTPLGSTVSELRFPYAADMVATGVGEATQVTVSGGRVWFSVTGSGVWRESGSLVADGWLETGRIRFGTVENKEWRSIRVTGELGMNGTVEARARVIGSGSPEDWDTAVTVDGDSPDGRGLLNRVAPAPQPGLFVAFWLDRGDDDLEGPVLTGFQVKALPAPERTELLQVPVMLFDREKDRTGVMHGFAGAHWQRFRALKDLEQSAGTVQWVDYTTGERAEAFIEQVTFSRSAPPAGASGTGGVAQIMLRLV